MKKLLTFLIITQLIACSTSQVIPADDATNPPAPTASKIFFGDSSKIYSTDLTGGNRRLLVGLDTTSLNSYLMGITTNADGSKIYFRHRVSGTPSTTKQYVVNADGTGLTLLKTFTSVNSNYDYTKLTSDNKLVFFDGLYIPPASYAKNIETLTLDGLTQTTVATIPASFTPNITQIGRANGIYLAEQYFPSGQVWYTGSLNASFQPQTPRALPVGAKQARLSDDGKVVAYYKTVNATTLELYTYNVATETATLLAPYTIPMVGVGTGGPGSSSVSTYFTWVEGTSKLMIYSALFTSPRGVPTDYAHCSIYTVGTTAAPTTFRFEGDGLYSKIFTID